MARIREMRGGRDNDASYYFGVARWIARLMPPRVSK